VAADAGSVPSLRELADRHRAAGVSVTDVDGPDLAGREPALAPGLAGGAYYPQDMQVQPMLAAAQLVRTASRDHGVAVVLGRAVTGIDHGADGQVTAVRTTAGRIATPAVVNAAGVWAADIARLAGVDLPVTPRRGFILVTQPLPALIRHKVYAADYMTAVASDTGELLTSAVIEGTRAGTVLIGSSRERVGFDGRVALPALRRLAAHAVRLFPVLGRARVLRAYHGFRPYSPDHLPLIGPDPRRPGLLHACGHEGAGVGLAPATGDLIAAMLTGAAPPVQAHPFRPSRFAGGEWNA
jgi:glycine/D-amino acid oxidase-like deaminating enzyme